MTFLHYLVIFTILAEILKLQWQNNFYFQWQLQIYLYLLAEAHNAMNTLIQNENILSIMYISDQVT